MGKERHGERGGRGVRERNERAERKGWREENGIRFFSLPLSIV